MKKIMLTICCLILVLIVWKISVRDDFKKLGEVRVNGCDSVFFEIYVENKFDNALAMEYEIKTIHDSILSPRYFLIGSSNFDEDVSEFYAGCDQGILYLTYLDSNLVCALYDLNSSLGYPRVLNNREDSKMLYKRADSLFLLLKSVNRDLKKRW